MASNSESLSQHLVEEIALSILSGKLAPGARLTETAMAEALGVNRAPLREALLRLEERQLIERVPFTGMRVAQLDLNRILELYEICEVLEGIACRRAAERITDRDVGRLAQILDESEERVRQLGGGDARQLPSFREFHKEIVRISGNAELEALLGREIWDFLRAAHRRWTRTPERLRESGKEHQAILMALSDRDPDLAEMLMRRHIRKIRAALVSSAGG